MACKSLGELVPLFDFLLQCASSLDIFSICVDSTVVSAEGFRNGSLILVVSNIA